MTLRLKSVVIGTAGHIDHGKTALVRALTGIDADRLPEEKRRGITIDLGFAAMEAQAADGSALRLSFVDVPGHKQFVRNMLAGAGCIDAVMLVISAEEGVKPQTEEHLAICSLLGIRRGLVVLSKSDAVTEERLEQVCADVQRFLAGTFLSEGNADVIPVSARLGDGVDELRDALISLGSESFDRKPDALLRLPLDRVFVMRGFGTVVTGTLLSGELKTGETLVLEPAGRTVRIRGIQTHGHAEEEAQAGSRVALNLGGVDVAEVHRGETLVAPGTLQAVDTVDVVVTLLSGCTELKHRARVHLHAFTSETMAAVSLYESASGAAGGGSQLMRLRLDQPVVLLPGDRFVLRQSSPAMTIGGGRIVDAHPLATLRKVKCLTWLQALRDAPRELQIVLRVGRRGTDGLSVTALSAETGLTANALNRDAAEIARDGRLHRVAGELLVTREAVSVAEDRVTTQLNAMAAHSGVKRSELRSQTRLRTEVLDYVLERLVRERKVRVQGELVLAAGPESLVPDDDRQKLEAIAAAYEVAGLAAPSAAEVAGKLAIGDAEMRRLVTLLLREKILVRLGSDALCVHHTALETLRAQMRELRAQRMDVARFKELTGLSRKYAIPLLEHLDRERITRKEGDHRVVL